MTKRIYPRSDNPRMASRDERFARSAALMRDGRERCVQDLMHDLRPLLATKQQVMRDLLLLQSSGQVCLTREAFPATGGSTPRRYFTQRAASASVAERTGNNPFDWRNYDAWAGVTMPPPGWGSTSRTGRGEAG